MLKTELQASGSSLDQSSSRSSVASLDEVSALGPEMPALQTRRCRPDSLAASSLLSFERSALEVTSHGPMLFLLGS